jgi:flagellum-specific peptidoglycan hydrolase FlgJ
LTIAPQRWPFGLEPTMQDYQRDYLDLAIPAAQASMIATGVPASITIAQGALESGWWRTKLAQIYNNGFGIKANQAQLADHDYCEFNTQEEENHTLETLKACFAQYATPEESFTAHAQLLCRPHYAAAMACTHDPDAFAWALGPKTPEHPEGCTYSTLTDYHDRLMELVHQFNLTQYDNPPEPPAVAQKMEIAA